MKLSKKWFYDYAEKCDCSDDDRCGCAFPENMERNYSCKNDESAHSRSSQKCTEPKTLKSNSAKESHGNFTA